MQIRKCLNCESNAALRWVEADVCGVPRQIKHSSWHRRSHPDTHRSFIPCLHLLAIGVSGSVDARHLTSSHVFESAASDCKEKFRNCFHASL